MLVRVLPPKLSTWAGAWGAGIYAALRPSRRRIVIENLLPVLGEDRNAAQRCATRLFRQFGRKLATLLRNESGTAGHYPVEHWSGIEQLESIHASGRGALIVTPHLGDWEVGGTLLAQRGYPLLVITHPEPGEDFTGMRGASRSRWGIDTLVVGADPFAFVDVIRRLQDGGIVAILLDRPAAGTGVEVALFGRKITASVAAAELARATGCAILPVYVVRAGTGYAAHMLPEVMYDRPALGSREARRVLTGEILRAFEPAIRQYPDQWFHFVPVWRS